MPPHPGSSGLSSAAQDYVKIIYGLTLDDTPASTNAIASRLGVSAASVTGMLQKLADTQPALVTYRKHQGARLTEQGRRAALEIIRHHRLLETWLVKTLGYAWDEVHVEAEKLEHALSEDLEARISRSLGDPARDPHGEPIPTADLVMPPEKSIPLAKMRAGEEGIVSRVLAPESGALRELEALGVKIGTSLKVVEASAFDRVVTLRIQGRRKFVTLGPALSERILVDSEQSSTRYLWSVR